MKYLLDVNALLALGYRERAFHIRTANWVRTLARRRDAELLTCSIVELGFVRVLAQAPQYGFSISQAKSILLRLKKSNILKFGFIADGHDASRILAWAGTARKTTDGHLAELARSHAALLATLDEGIPDAFLIPG